MSASSGRVLWPPSLRASPGVTPFVIRVTPAERGDDGPTRPFWVRGGVFLRCGIGGSWGCVGVEIYRSAAVAGAGGVRLQPPGRRTCPPKPRTRPTFTRMSNQNLTTHPEARTPVAVMVDTADGYAEEHIWVEVTDRTATEPQARVEAFEHCAEGAAPHDLLRRVWLRPRTASEFEDQWQEADGPARDALEFWHFQIGDQDDV